MKNVSQPSSRRAARYSISRSNARPEVRTRSTGRISDSIERIGLIFSVEPSHAWAPPTRPPRRRNSSVSTANQTLSSRRSAWAASAASSARRARARRRRRGDRHHAEPRAGGGGVEHDQPRRVDPALHELVARLLGGRERARDAGGEVDREDVRAVVEQRLVDGEEVADRRLRGARHLARGAQPRVEVVEVGDLGLALGRAVERDVERHLVEPELLDERARHVVRRVRHDGDPGHGPERSR